MPSWKVSTAKASEVTDRLCLYGAGGLLVVNLLDIGLSVLGRFTGLYRVPVWSADVARLTLVWMVMLAAVPAFTRGQHMAIAIIAERMPRGVRQVVVVLREVAFAALLIVMTAYGVGYAHKLRLFTILTLGLSKSVFLMSIPVGMGLMLLQYTLRLLVGFVPTHADAQERSADHGKGENRL